MKLSQKQAELLASEVLKALKRQGATQVSESTIENLRQWKEKRDKLLKAEQEAEQTRRRHDKELEYITGKVKNVNAYDPLNKMIEKMKEGNTPSLSEITDKIILKAMFTTDEDLQSFVQSIVKEFSKKKSVTAN